MIANLLTVITVLGLLFGFASAANLRSMVDALNYSIPANPELIQKIGNHLEKSFENRVQKNLQSASLSTGKIHADLKSLIHAHKRSGAEKDITALKEIESFAQIRYGSLVERYRPNSDCSGVPSWVISSRILGDCMDDDDGGSYYASCGRENDEGQVSLLVTYFNLPNCDASMGSEQVPYYVDAKCRYSPADTSNPNLPEMKTMQCSNKALVEFAYPHGGVAFNRYQCGDNSCDCEPVSVSLERFHTCVIVYLWYDDLGNEVDYPTTSGLNRFYYYTVDSCSAADGTFQMTVYTDRACTRPLARDSYALSDHNQCLATTTADTFRRTVCIPQTPR